MNICVLEYGEISYLTDGAFNLLADLKDNSIYLSSINKVNSIGELKNSISKDFVYIVYSNEKDNYFLKKSLIEYKNDEGYYLINSSKIYLLCSTLNYFNNLNEIISSLKTERTVYKLYNVNEEDLKLFLDEQNVSYKTYTNGLDTKVILDFSSLTDEERWNFLKNFTLKFDEYIYAESDTSLQGQLVKILSLRQLKMSVAESFTAGALASKITSISGSSKVFYEGIVAYNENAKIDRLGVLDKTIKFKRPVSQETAYEMCLGLLKKDVDLVISTTGIAGPNSDESSYPVGLAYIGIGSKRKVAVYRFTFDGSRKDITNKGVNQAIFMAIKALRNGSFDI